MAGEEDLSRLSSRLYKKSHKSQVVRFDFVTTMTPSPTETGMDKDAIIASLVDETRKLQATVNTLQQKIAHGESFDTVRTDMNEILSF